VDEIEIKKQIIEIIENSTHKITQRDLETAVAAKYKTTSKAIRKIVKSLVSGGKLSYTNIHGRTFIEISYSQPVRVSDHIILKPSGLKNVQQNSNDIVIELMLGDAFGTGHHPTTQLALQGIEYLKMETGVFGMSDELCALDIGTGSGVLAIAAVKLGVGSAVGIDIDPCACHEARENVRLNNLEGKVDISANSPDSFNRRFDLLIANLRSPTILALCSQISDLTAENGSIVFSGIKDEEADKVVKVYKAAGFKDQWQKLYKSWAGLVFIK